MYRATYEKGEEVAHIIFDSEKVVEVVSFMDDEHGLNIPFAVFEAVVDFIKNGGRLSDGAVDVRISSTETLRILYHDEED